MSVATRPRGVTNKVTLSPRETELIGQIAAGFNAPSTPDSIVFMTAGTGRKQALTEGLRLIRTALVPSIHLPELTAPRVRFDRQTVARLASLAVTTLVTVAVVMVGFNLPTIGTSAPSAPAPAVSLAAPVITPSPIVLPEVAAPAPALAPKAMTPVKAAPATQVATQPAARTNKVPAAAPAPSASVRPAARPAPSAAPAPAPLAKPATPVTSVRTPIPPPANVPVPVVETPAPVPPVVAAPAPPVVQAPAPGPINTFVGSTGGSGTTGGPIVDQAVAGGSATGNATPVGTDLTSVSNPGASSSIG